MSELEDDDALVDDAVKMGAMHFIRQSVVASQHFHQEVQQILIQEFELDLGQGLIQAQDYQVLILCYVHVRVYFRNSRERNEPQPQIWEISRILLCSSPSKYIPA